MLVREIFEFLDGKAPCEIKMDFDNVGLLAGSLDWEIDKVLLALDITDAVISEAIELGAGLVISHHPIFFSLKTITGSDPLGRRTLMLLSNKIAAICMHTNLDAVSGGVNDALAAACGLNGIELLETSGTDRNGNSYGIGRVGKLDNPQSLHEYLGTVKTSIGAEALRYYDAGREVNRVAVGSGSCGDYLQAAVKCGCDTFISADLKYDVFLEAANFGINLIDGGHYCTENVVIPTLHKWISGCFESLDVIVSKTHSDTVRFYM